MHLVRFQAYICYKLMRSKAVKCQVAVSFYIFDRHIDFDFSTSNDFNSVAIRSGVVNVKLQL